MWAARFYTKVHGPAQRFLELHGSLSKPKPLNSILQWEAVDPSCTSTFMKILIAEGEGSTPILFLGTDPQNMPLLRQREWKGNQEPLHLALAVLGILQRPPFHEEHKDFPLPTPMQSPLGTSTTSTHPFRHIMG